MKTKKIVKKVKVKSVNSENDEVLFVIDSTLYSIKRDLELLERLINEIK